MFDNPALETAFAVLRMTMQRPLGLIAVCLFLGGITAFLVFRDISPRASVTSFWFVLIGCVGLAYEASETMRLNPDMTRFRRAALTAPSADVRPVSPPPTSRTSAVNPNSGTSIPGGASTSPSPSSGGGSGSGLAASGESAAGAAPDNATSATTRSASNRRDDQKDDQARRAGDGTSPDRTQTFSSIQWVTDRIVSEERVTGNHKCADVPGAFNPRACKTGYAIALTCDEGKRLTAPQLHCLEGDCSASTITDVRVSPDGRRVDARFEVWGAPTRWQLTAVREESTPPNP